MLCRSTSVFTSSQVFCLYNVHENYIISIVYSIYVSIYPSRLKIHYKNTVYNECTQMQWHTSHAPRIIELPQNQIYTQVRYVLTQQILGKKIMTFFLLVKSSIKKRKTRFGISFRRQEDTFLRNKKCYQLLWNYLL